MNLPALKYPILKEIAINLSSVGIPLSFLSGFLLGTGKWGLGLLVLALYLLIDNITGRLWFRVLELMQRKR